MSTTPSPPPAGPVPPAGTIPVPPAHAPAENKIKVISHSMLFYWWPVWFFGFIFSIWTYIDQTYMLILPKGAKVTVTEDNDVNKTTHVKVEANMHGAKWDELKKNLVDKDGIPTKHMSWRAWMGPAYLIVLFLVILITNVPLRGLWSLVTVITISFLTALFAFMGWWDEILRAFADLHGYMNMAVYLTISVGVFIAWITAVLFFDRRSYMIFSPGQLRVCEEIGGREKVYDTTLMTVEKHRDDWFRHIILGFGSGDLTVRTSRDEKIYLPNVLFIGFKIRPIEEMLRSRNIMASP